MGAREQEVSGKHRDFKNDMILITLNSACFHFFNWKVIHVTETNFTYSDFWLQAKRDVGVLLLWLILPMYWNTRQKYTELVLASLK